MDNIKEQFDKIMEIIKNNDYREYGGIVRAKICLADYNEIEKVAPDFINPSDQWNDAPSQEEFVNFVKEYPEFAMEVDIINPYERSDYRMIIDGLYTISMNTSSVKALAKFIENCSGSTPDEYSVEDGLRAWWD